MTSKVDQALYGINSVMCRHIDNISRDSRGEVAQDVVSDLRHFVEHIMLKIYDKDNSLDVIYDNIDKSKAYIFKNNQYKLLSNFHKLLQIVVSHYKPTEESSEWLMLKYYEYLFKIREMMKKDYDLDLLQNLEKFPLNIDPKLQEYYEKIAAEIDNYKNTSQDDSGRFYIHKIKPFFVNRKMYYEVTFSPANDYRSKTDRVIAFTNIPLETNYASKMSFVSSSIEIMGHKMPILLIVGWEISIRECEFKNFTKLVKGENNGVTYEERTALCAYMTEQKLNLLDVVELQDSEYHDLKLEIQQCTGVTNFLSVLDICRDIINNDRDGKNILRYLLFIMNNTVIKRQYTATQNINLSNLHVKNGVIPFDKMPFTFSPIKHNPPINILLKCFDVEKHDPEMLARLIISNTEYRGNLFTSLKEFDEPEEEIQDLVVNYNDGLWEGHRPENDLIIDKGQIFIQKYVQDCRFIIDRLRYLSTQGVLNYTNFVDDWLNQGFYEITCEETKEVIRNLFANSKVSMVYGAAGTGKSTLINHISHLFANKSKLLLAQTHPAVDNLKRKVSASNCDFMTVKKFILNNSVPTAYDILIIDECSTVSNADMRKVLEKASFKLLVLVGDIYQIESIRFGNWFSIAQKLIPEESSVELTTIHRSKDSELKKIWDKVRKMDDDVIEHFTKTTYTNRLDESVFEPSDEDEIILCLNYDGLYGINNVNRFLQESNSSKCVQWGVQTFKVGDPILFHDTGRFGHVIYNNMKGRISNISILSRGKPDERIEFDIELDKEINGMDVIAGEFDLLDPDVYMEAKNSVIRFSVYKNKNTDADDFDWRTIIPFQVSYAVSIHKAQGLEFNSVKIIITNEIDEMITHNIFYTAVTRARSKLKVYWSPEVGNKVLSVIKPRNNSKDSNLLYQVKL